MEDFPSDDIYFMDKNSEYQQLKKVELLRRKSYHCLSKKDKAVLRDMYKNLGKDSAIKIMLVLMTSITTYYGFFTVLLPRLINYFGISSTEQILLAVVFGSLYVFLLFWFIHKGDFNKTQALLFTLTYTVFSVFGIVVFISTSVPISAYQVFNTFIYILIIQLFVLAISTFLTRRLVCRLT